MGSRHILMRANESDIYNLVLFRGNESNYQAKNQYVYARNQILSSGYSSEGSPKEFFIIKGCFCAFLGV